MSAASTPIIALENARIRFNIGNGNTCTPLDGADIEVANGEFVAILGDSGAGKTVCLHALAGLRRLDNGSVRFRGRALTPESDEFRAFLNRTPIVYQESSSGLGLLGGLTIFENVILPLRLRGAITAAMLRRANAVLEQVGLGRRRNSFPRELSGGMKVRAVLARALLAGEGLILADEPCGSLDPNISLEIIKLLRNSGKAVVFVTHNPLQVRDCCHRALLLYRGRFVDVTRLLKDKPRLFLGSVPYARLVEGMAHK